MMSTDKGQGSSGRTLLAEVLSTRTEQEVEQQLLPGIPNEVTLNHIAPKLSWTAIQTLPIVSNAWQLAIQSRQVYDERVRFNSTTTLVAVDHSVIPANPRVKPQSFIALYSMEERCFYFLPSIPHVDGGIPVLCQCVSLAGRLYVLGGRKKQHSLSKFGSQDVYVLDLVGRRHWKQCASMNKPRESFTCGVLNGKIYVFGGYSLGVAVSLAEVYDPKVDAWSPIKPMLSKRRSNHVAAVGEELCVYAGGLVGSGHAKEALFEFYHPVQDEWRKVDAIRRRNGIEVVFAAGGKFYAMNQLKISVHDSETGTWVLRHSFSFLHETLKADLTEPVAVLAVDNELLAMVRWFQNRPPRNNAGTGVSLLRSKGFGGLNQGILWEKVNNKLRFRDYLPFMSPVQL